jgi:hypothetical protein
MTTRVRRHSTNCGRAEIFLAEFDSMYGKRHPVKYGGSYSILPILLPKPYPYDASVSWGALMVGGQSLTTVRFGPR